MRVLLADDQPEICSAMRLLLEQETEIEIVGEADEAESLLRQARLVSPDVVLLDWELPGGEHSDGKNGAGPRLIQALRAEYPGLRVVALSGRPEARLAALAAGADAFVSKGDPPERLLSVVLDVESEAASAAH